MTGQSNSLRSVDEPNLRAPGDFFGFQEDASQSDDEPNFGKRRYTANVIESSEDERDEMDISFSTLVNPSPTASIIFTGSKHTAKVNGVALTKLGSRNAFKLKESGQFPKGPKSKECADCGKVMDSRTTGQMTRAKKNGPFYYHKNHNGSCQKGNISIVVKEKVESGIRCHNPRCSGINPVFLWDSNQKKYCSMLCVVGYQDWHNEAKHLRETIPEKYKEWVAQKMRNGDMEFKKKKSATSDVWRNFIIPPIEYYHNIIKQMETATMENAPAVLNQN